jgi:hypothetical protein
MMRKTNASGRGGDGGGDDGGSSLATLRRDAVEEGVDGRVRGGHGAQQGDDNHKEHDRRNNREFLNVRWSYGAKRYFFHF